jgi:toxin ParE1/3/4
MTHDVIFAPEASDDLESLLVYLIEKAGPDIARRYVANIEEFCLGLTRFPQRGLARDDLRSGLRITGFKRKASIAFTVEDQTVYILRIFHAGREISFDAHDLDDAVRDAP